jgi:Uma2 family endonuclease
MGATVQTRRFTLDDYWDVERGSAVKHEFLHGAIYVMAGARPRHNELCANTQAALWNALQASPCRPLGSDQRIAVSADEYTYADLSVFCGSVETAPGPPPGSATNPVALVEVLSDSTREYDQGEKLEMYLRIRSLRTVLLIEPDEVRVTVWSREETGSPRSFPRSTNRFR